MGGIYNTIINNLRQSYKRRNYFVLRFFGYPTAWIVRRLALRTDVIGITGSVGKTTCKDLCTTMLTEFGNCSGTVRSKNERLAIIKTLLQLRFHHRYFVIEMSGSPPGSLDRAMRIAAPSIGVLTNIGRDHFKAFGGVRNIAKEKQKIVQLLPENGIAVLNIDDDQVKAIGEAWPYKKIWVGSESGATIRLLKVSSDWPNPLTLTVEFNNQTYTVRTQLHGKHLALSVLCALGVAVALKLPLEKAIVGIAQTVPPEGRMQIVEGEDGVTFIRDDWKAPEWTLQAPLDFLKEATATRKVAIIGSLSDFSTDNSSKYKQVAKKVRELADLTIFVGPNAPRALRARKDPDDLSLMGFEHIGDAAKFLKHELRAGDLVLLKGSAKADHLVRLLYDRYKSVQCWKDQCGVDVFCGYCPKLYQQAVQDSQCEENTKAVLPLSDTRLAWGTPSDKITTVIGLGNPGTRYKDTPHNIGYEVVDALADSVGAVWQAHSEGLVTVVEINPETSVLLFKPSTSMNHTGSPVRKFLSECNGHPEKCILVHDEMDLQVGDIRFKEEGTSAGHNGVKSVLSALNTYTVPRLRVGVRLTNERVAAKQHVLTPFSGEDRHQIDRSIIKAAEMIRQTVTNSQNFIH